MAVPLRGGGEGLPLRRKNTFFYEKVPTAIKLEGEEGKALMAMPLRKNGFLKADLRK